MARIIKNNLDHKPKKLTETNVLRELESLVRSTKRVQNMRRSAPQPARTESLKDVPILTNIHSGDQQL